MKRHARRRSPLGALLLAGLGAVACGPRPASEPGPAATASGVPHESPEAVARLEIGHCTDGEQHTVDAATLFAPADEICVAVRRVDAGARLRLTGAGDPPVDQEIPVATSGESGEGFGHFARAGGWPPGRYRLSVWAEDRELAARELEVRAEVEPQLPPA